MISNCKYCGSSHKRANCPAYRKICNKCQRRGHFASCCLSKTKNINKVSAIHDESTDDDNDENPLFLGMIKS